MAIARALDQQFTAEGRRLSQTEFSALVEAEYIRVKHHLPISGAPPVQRGQKEELIQRGQHASPVISGQDAGSGHQGSRLDINRPQPVQRGPPNSANSMEVGLTTSSVLIRPDMNEIPLHIPGPTPMPAIPQIPPHIHGQNPRPAIHSISSHIPGQTPRPAIHPIPSHIPGQTSRPGIHPIPPQIPGQTSRPAIHPIPTHISTPTSRPAIHPIPPPVSTSVGLQSMRTVPVKQEVESVSAPVAANALNIDWNGLSDILKQVKPQQLITPQQPTLVGPQQVYNGPPPGSQLSTGNSSHPVNTSQQPIGKSQRPNDVSNTSIGQQSTNGNAENQAIKAEPVAEPEEEEDFYADFTDEELISLLKNFKSLEPLEQKDLIGYMKKLESEDPERVTKLKEAMHTK